MTNDKTNNKSIPLTETEKKRIYQDIMQLIAETGLSTKDAYDNLVLGFQSYFIGHVYRELDPLRKEISQKPLKEVI